MSVFTKTLPILLLLANGSVLAEDKKEPAKDAPPPASATGAEQVNVDAIKEKYWARGDESELGVVQNRLYSKESKYEFGLMGGFLTSDPFLSVKSVGGTLGYHFTEYLSLNVVGWKSFVSESAAYEGYLLGTAKGGGAPSIPATNYPKYYYGLEPSFSLLYGKLSVVGKAIIYYDMHLLGGIGVTGTEYKPLFTPHIGVGQQIFLSKLVSLRADYRIMYYSERLIKKRHPSEAPIQGEGQPIEESRDNWTHAITVGVNFLFGVGQ